MNDRERCNCKGCSPRTEKPQEPLPVEEGIQVPLSPTTASERPYRAAESILSGDIRDGLRSTPIETTLCGNCGIEYDCLCHVTCDEPVTVDATNPLHYAKLDPQPWHVIRAWDLGYLDGSVIKYVSRWRNKNGLEDLKKARTFLDELIRTESANE